MKAFLLFLKTHPQVGVISGAFSWSVATVQTIFTNEIWLKIAAAVGVYAGACVALLTMGLKIWDYFDRAKGKRGNDHGTFI